MEWILPNFDRHGSFVFNLLLVTKTVRILRFLRLLSLCKVCHPKVVICLNARIDSNITFAYEIGKAYVTGEEEVLERLTHIIDHDGIREQLRTKMEGDRRKVTKLLGLSQKDRPWIAITVKTQQAIRTALNTMKEGVNELRTSGWIDDAEYNHLMNSLNEQYKYVRTISSVQPSPPKVLFKEVPWMTGDEDVIDYLYEKTFTRKFDPGDVICGEGVVSEGIYIVVTGLLLLTYNPDKDILSQLAEQGSLPVTDYTPNITFDETVSEYIVSGNCIGELSTLTGRPYNCTITSETYSQAYVLTREVINNAMALNSDPINGLESRLWRSISVRIAMLVLVNVPTYQGANQDQIKYALERAFVPNLSNYKIFVVNDMMEDIILIEGIIVDYHTKEVFTAPCYIPRTVQRIILPKSSSISIPSTIDTRLLIIPVKDVDEYEIMIKEEQISEMVSTVSSKCLQHIVQSRSSKFKNRKPKGMLSQYSKKATSNTLAEKSSKWAVRSKSGMTVNSEAELETEAELEMRSISMTVSESMKGSIPSKK